MKNYIIKINENIKMRGLNNLFYGVEIFDENNRLIRSVQYPRTIASILHETPIFAFFKKANGEKINSSQCEEYCEKLEAVIRMIEKINSIY